MKKTDRMTLYLVVALILLTGVVMGVLGYSQTSKARFIDATAGHAGTKVGPVFMSARLVQDKVLKGSDGVVTLALTLKAPEQDPEGGKRDQAVDMVVVLDRSGSMQGRKISDACRAVQQLMGDLSPRDRLALITYSNTAEQRTGLGPMNADNRSALASAVNAIQPGGGTNLGAGLMAGLDVLASAPAGERQRMVILISDGLANQGITDPYALGRLAGGGPTNDSVVSTVGVGNDFNEQLLTTLADHGAGNYYYLENPAAFASVFQREYRQSAMTAVSGLSVSVPATDMFRLIDAGGYPIETRDGRRHFSPGSLRFGQKRTIYLTFEVATGELGAVNLQGLQVRFHTAGGSFTTTLPDAFSVACVENPDEVMASIRKEAWAAKVIQEDFGRLKEAVADAIRNGDQGEAMQRIQSYRQEKAAANRVVASPQVATNLKEEVKALDEYVRETFSGKPEAVARKQKKNAKVLQYDAYQKRRDKN